MNTASQIAEIIGGISRNAVIGKAHRLNLSAKIKTRAATSNQNFENSQIDKNNNPRRGRKSKFKSLIIEKGIFCTTDFDCHIINSNSGDFEYPTLEKCRKTKCIN